MHSVDIQSDTGFFFTTLVHKKGWCVYLKDSSLPKKKKKRKNQRTNNSQQNSNIKTKSKKRIKHRRINSHSLNVETGRYFNISRNESVCNMCNKKVIEDEYHFILECDKYVNVRSKYYYRLVKPIYLQISSISICKKY